MLIVNSWRIVAWIPPVELRLTQIQHSYSMQYQLLLPEVDGRRTLLLFIRDIKPQNVMLSDSGTPVLMDFGSMGPAKTEIKNSYQARAMQVLHHYIIFEAIVILFLFEHCSGLRFVLFRTWPQSDAPCHTGHRSSFMLKAIQWLMRKLIYG